MAKKKPIVQRYFEELNRRESEKRDRALKAMEHEEMLSEKRRVAKEIKSELFTWERKCRNRIERGDKPACKFNSKLVADWWLQSIHNKLEKAETYSEVEQIFGSLYTWLDANYESVYVPEGDEK